MPVTPKQARKLAQERDSILEAVDEAILEAYTCEESPTRVLVAISRYYYENEQFIAWLTEQYTKAGWYVSFENTENDKEMNIVLMEKKSKE